MLPFRATRSDASVSGGMIAIRSIEPTMSRTSSRHTAEYASFGGRRSHRPSVNPEPLSPAPLEGPKAAPCRHAFEYPFPVEEFVLAPPVLSTISSPRIRAPPPGTAPQREAESGRE